MKKNKWNIFFNVIWMSVGVITIIKYYPKLDYLKIFVGLVIILSSIYSIYNYVLDKNDGER